METLLAILILALLIDKGLSLGCEECIGIGTCSGKVYPCAPEKDKCGIAYLNTQLGLSQVIKTCIPSMVCDKGVQVMNLGQLGTMVAQLTCCEGDGCGKVDPPSFPKQTTPNGKRCPTCFSPQNTCYEEIASCNGDEMYCAEGFLRSGIDKFGLEFSVKGCANKLLCDDLLGYETLVAGNSLNLSVRCTPASTATHLQDVLTVSQPDSSILTQGNSGAMRTFPGWFGLIALAISGTLFRKLLA